MSEINKEIIRGHWDDDLDSLENAIKSRRKIIALQTISTLTAGDQVRIRACSPKFLIGTTATVVSVDGESLKVRMPFFYNKPKWSEQVIGVKASMVEAI